MRWLVVKRVGKCSGVWVSNSMIVSSDLMLKRLGLRRSKVNEFRMCPWCLLYVARETCLLNTMRNKSLIWCRIIESWENLNAELLALVTESPPGWFFLSASLFDNLRSRANQQCCNIRVDSSYSGLQPHLPLRRKKSCFRVPHSGP